MNPFEMVVAIIIVVTIGKVLNTRFQAKHGIIEDEYGNKSAAVSQLSLDQDTEVKELKERVKVLERIVTDNDSAMNLDREIEKLRNK